MGTDHAAWGQERRELETTGVREGANVRGGAGGVRKVKNLWAGARPELESRLEGRSAGDGLADGGAQFARQRRAQRARATSLWTTLVSGAHLWLVAYAGAVKPLLLSTS